MPFLEGAWITLLALPALIFLFKTFKNYYDGVGRRLWEPRPLDLSANEPPLVVMPMETWNGLSKKALRFGMLLSPEVTAVHLSALNGDNAASTAGAADAKEESETLESQWKVEVEEPARQAGLSLPRLVVLQSPYRRFLEPLLRFLRGLEEEHPGRVVAVIVPLLLKRHWWQYLLHNRRAWQLRSALLEKGGSRVVVIDVPWDLEGEDARR